VQDHLAASISPPTQEGSQHTSPVQQGEGAGNANTNSILAVADDLGLVNFFLDGTYPLGAVALSPGISTPSLFKHPQDPTFLAHTQNSIHNTVITGLQATMIELPLLRTRKPRDLAKLSSTTRELVWYATRVVREMRAVWFGSDTSSGARELGPKWIRALETKQKEQFGRECRQSLRDPLIKVHFRPIQRRSQTVY
jgi:anaphase-promoting complex subunit 4